MDKNELDRKIENIQQSTRTLFPTFAHLHDWLRLRSRAYYNWHTNPKSSLVHYAAMTLSFLIAISFVFVTYQNQFVDQSTAATNPVTLTSQADWQEGVAIVEITTTESVGDVVLNNSSIGWDTIKGSPSCSNPPGFSCRSSNEALVYDNKMWVMGGNNGVGNLNDVWYSTDGATWTEATASANWSARNNFSALVYDNKMWVMGGWGASVYNDVWYSTDGVTWTEATASANWSVRRDLASVVYNNKMWVTGGDNGQGAYKNDVWYSTDGITWTEATASANWNVRSYHGAVVYNNKMWVMGGGTTTVFKNDVWYSTDGVTWTEATASANWSIRRSFGLVVYDGSMWLIAGRGAGNKNTWYSTDGVTWTELTIQSGMVFFQGSVAEHFPAIVYNGSIYTVGGWAGGGHETSVYRMRGTTGKHYSRFNFATDDFQVDGGVDFVGWTTLETTATVPAGTTLKYKFNTSDGSSWSGLTGYYDYAASIDISDLPANRYLVVYSYLESTTPLVTPTLSAYTVNYTDSTVASVATFDHLEIKKSSEADSAYATSQSYSYVVANAGNTESFVTRAIDTDTTVMTGVTFTYSSSDCTNVSANQFKVPAEGASCTVSVTSSSGGLATAVMTTEVAPPTSDVPPAPDPPDEIDWIYVEMSPENIALEPGEEWDYKARAFDQNSKNITKECLFAWQLLDENVGTIKSTDNERMRLKTKSPGEFVASIEVVATCGNDSDFAYGSVGVVGIDSNTDWVLRPVFNQINSDINWATKAWFRLYIPFSSGSLYARHGEKIEISITDSEAGDLIEKWGEIDAKYFLPAKEGCFPNLFKGEFKWGDKTYVAFSGVNVSSTDPDSEYSGNQPNVASTLIKRQHFFQGMRADVGGRVYNNTGEEVPTRLISYKIDWAKDGEVGLSPIRVKEKYILNDDTIGKLAKKGAIKIATDVPLGLHKNAFTSIHTFNGKSISKNWDIWIEKKFKNELVLPQIDTVLRLPPDSIYFYKTQPRGHLKNQYGDFFSGYYNIEFDSALESFQPHELYFKTPSESKTYFGVITIINPRSGERKTLDVEVDSTLSIDSCIATNTTIDSTDPKEPKDPGSPKICIGSWCFDPSEPLIPNEGIVNVLIAILALITSPLVVSSALTSLLSRVAYSSYLFPVAALKRKRPGIVYDARTKWPLKLSKVLVYSKDGKITHKLITDHRGEFILPKVAGKYYIVVDKNGYTPTKDKGHEKVADFKDSDGYYDSIYYNKQIINVKAIEQGDVFAMAIPMNPKKKQSDFIKLYQKIVRNVRKYSPLILIGGTVISSIYLFYARTDLVAQIVFIGYILLWMFQIYEWLVFRKINGKVSGNNGQPLEKAMVRVKDKKGGIVETTLTDELGRFRIGLARKDYKLDFQKPGYRKKLNIDLPYTTFGHKLTVVLTKK